LLLHISKVPFSILGTKAKFLIEILFSAAFRLDSGSRSPLTGFHDDTQTHHTRKDSSGRVVSSSQRPLPENTQHSKQTHMPPVGFEPTIPASEWSQTHSLDRAITGIGT